MAAADVSCSCLETRATTDLDYGQLLYEVLSVMVKTPLGKVASK